MAVWQRQVVEGAIANAGHHLPRFAVFSLAPIPLAIQLGFLLSDRVEVRCFQFDRDRRSWTWRPAQVACARSRLRVAGIPADTIPGPCEVVVRISLSASVLPEDTRLICPSGAIEIDISAQRPNVTWLKTPAQLSTLGTRFREVLAAVRRTVPGCTALHLFYAGPTGGAVVLGQQINPRMDPPVVLYQYSRQKTVRHQPVLTLADCSSKGALFSTARRPGSGAYSREGAVVQGATRLTLPASTRTEPAGAGRPGIFTR
jgi:hypothetical protein